MGGVTTIIDVVEKFERIENIKILTSNYFAMIKKILENAKFYFYISTFTIEPPERRTKKEIKELWELFFLKQKEIDLKIITDCGIGAQGAELNIYKLLKYLKGKEINLRIHQGHYKLHAKFLTADNQYFVIGSHNLTSRSIMNDKDLSLFGENRIIAKRLKEIFENYYNNSIYYKTYIKGL